mmetsp:Transcript_5978/g.12747  ORF Transcript_5978/g.12747 Transcript_5978/m.12747 type:complete len:131 (-) Transcript_5978:143-535(-)
MPTSPPGYARTALCSTVHDPRMPGGPTRAGKTKAGDLPRCPARLGRSHVDVHEHFPLHLPVHPTTPWTENSGTIRRFLAVQPNSSPPSSRSRAGGGHVVVAAPPPGRRRTRRKSSSSLSGTFSVVSTNHF